MRRASATSRTGSADSPPVNLPILLTPKRRHVEKVPRIDKYLVAAAGHEVCAVAHDESQAGCLSAAHYARRAEAVFDQWLDPDRRRSGCIHAE